jgi:hypothetical protein
MARCGLVVHVLSLSTETPNISNIVDALKCWTSAIQDELALCAGFLVERRELLDAVDVE